MTRAEILSEIKQAEEEAKNFVAKANEARDKKITEAKAESREIIRKAEEEGLEYASSEINKAREIIRAERDKITDKGSLDAEDIKKKAKKNIPKATKHILTEFERAVNA